MWGGNDLTTNNRINIQLIDNILKTPPQDELNIFKIPILDNTSLKEHEGNA